MTPLPLRLLLTGSREGVGEHLVFGKLSEKRQQAGSRGLILVHGDCPDGVDNSGNRWYERERMHQPPLFEEAHPANWNKYGNSAGFRRNEVMVRMGAWGVLGLVAPCTKKDCKRKPQPHGTHGTMHCLKVAKHYGLPIQAWKVNW